MAINRLKKEIKDNIQGSKEGKNLPVKLFEIAQSMDAKEVNIDNEEIQVPDYQSNLVSSPPDVKIKI